MSAEFVDPWQGDKVNHGPPAHVAWRSGTTTLCRSWLYLQDLWIRLQVASWLSSSGMEGDDELGPKWRGILDGGLLEDVGWDAQVGEVQLARPGRVGQRQHAHHRHPVHHKHKCLCWHEGSVADPDPHVFGSPGSGSGSISQRYGSGSFYH